MPLNRKYHIMKKIKILIVSALVLGGIVSCSDELELLPLDRITTATFYQDRSQFDGAIFAAYSSITDFWGTSTETLSERGEYWKLTMLITDDVAVAVDGADAISKDVDNLQLRASDVPFAAIYTQIYEGILRTNIVLENLDGENSLTAEDKTVLNAEAKFLRAFFHFQALKMYGTPPLYLEVKTDLSDLANPNATQDELYASILSDLGEAAAGLPEAWDGGNTGRATAWAAKSFIGKVNVFKEDYGAAITAFADVVTNGPYSLVADYEEAFAFTNENNSESIFEIQYGGPQSDDNLWVFDDTHSEDFKASQGTGRPWYWDAGAEVGAPGNKLGWWAPTQDLVDVYEAGDTRLEASIWQAGDQYIAFGRGATGRIDVPYDPSWSLTGLTFRKYRGPMNSFAENHPPNQGADFNNERWFRFAELKLLYAEALILGGGDAGIAIQQIQDIRDRAGLTDPMDPDPLTAMMKEKRVEMAFEPHRWFDIVRWDLGATIFPTAWDPKYVVFPFPQSEIDRSGGLLTQNPGY